MGKFLVDILLNHVKWKSVSHSALLYSVIQYNKHDKTEYEIEFQFTWIMRMINQPQFPPKWIFSMILFYREVEMIISAILAIHVFFIFFVFHISLILFSSYVFLLHIIFFSSSSSGPLFLEPHRILSDVITEFYDFFILISLLCYQ